MNRLLCDSVMALALLLLAVASQVLCQLCDRPCLCLRPVPQCHPGVPLVLDDCRCCQVCARQQGREDLACKVNGISYQDGQSFQPSCDTYCHCRGGGVSCVSTCPLNVRMPTSDCPHPQHVRLPGKCCKEWVCENLENSVLQDAITAMRPNVRWPPSPVQAVSTCAEQSTQWSACSQSCGAGISTRVSNQNLACRLQMETRLCKVRPCHSQLPMPNRTMRGQQGQCTASYTSQGPIRLVHQGCHSTRSYQLHYCGRCTDSRCCTPFQTSTAQVTFRCPTGSLLQRAVMMIHSCACHANCPYAPFRNPALWGYRP
ncbi:WNT1-inducible-signaling pathway protein 2 isoform X2 [Nerophis ophidion]|uniref:WNT1-inducible-signaling pathway protein 2 isoform X2 n=1 Tax=Nerophis ophidion TaxID=159077 RepID=UPI002AE037F9|nr:WNT1-inducible-signaling pathway protein 2 isoform X2 [Nerophis ophidion]